MKNKNIKPIVMSALAAFALGTMTVGTTFALFTDKAEVSIAAESGVVDIDFTPSGLITYSAEANENGNLIDEYGAKYISKLTETSGVFTNGGTATLSDNTLTLERITPGDRVVFNAAIDNQSNVIIKYRLYYLANDNDNELAPALVTTTDLSGTSTSYTGLKKYVSPWMTLQPSANPVQTDFAFDIEMPIDIGNDYQEKSASFVLGIEAVQGNAAVVDQHTIESYDAIAKTVVATDSDTTVEGANTDESIRVKAVIPAAAEQVNANDTVTLLVGEIGKEENANDPDYTDVNFDLSLLVNGQTVSSFSEFIDVEIYVGPGLGITKVTHNGNEIEAFDYDPQTGIVSFQTKDFSPYVVTYHDPNPNEGFLDSFEIDGKKVNVIDSPAHFAKMIDNLDEALAGGQEAIEEAKATVYRLNRDIDLSSVESGAYLAKTFIGTLDGNGHAIRNYSVDGGDSLVGGGLFGKYYEGSIVKNLSLDYIDIRGKESLGVLFGMSYNHAQNKTTSADVAGTKLTIENVTIGEHCSVTGVKGLGGVAGSTRYTEQVIVKNVINKADVSGSGYNAGGFFGTMTSVSTFQATNCQNYGNIRATTNAAGFTGHCDSLTSISISGCKNFGRITVFGQNKNKAQAGWFAAQHANNASLFYSGNTNEGSIYYISDNASIFEAFEADFVGNGIAVAAGKTAADYLVCDDTVLLSVSTNQNNDWVVSEVADAAYYSVTMQIYSHDVTLSGDTATVIKERGHVFVRNYDSVDAIKDGIGCITRVGYVLDSVYTKYGYDPLTSSQNFTMNGRANFFRLPYANREQYQLNEVVWDINLNEWVYVIDAEEGCLEGTGVIFSPKDTYVHYLFEAYDANDHLLAFKEIRFDPTNGASVVKNMNGDTFAGHTAESGTIYPDVA